MKTLEPHAERAAATPAGRSLRIGARRYPMVLPNVRDPRLHLAAVIISIHILGQVALGFQVSVVQILVAILTCAAIEVTWTLYRSGSIVWPASAMLTGSGVALILRVVGTENGDYWSWRGWYIFAIVAGLSLLTKYTIQYRGSHVFNPSNVGLVAAFLVLGSTRVEPLDFWWAPFEGWMVVAYLIILVGGLLITARLHLLSMSVAFWITLAAGIGLLAASGHCMTARWSFTPVCGAQFWRVIVLSPEILIFLFFMITDPKTIPAGRVARIAFGVSVAVASTLLIAPQTTEFGAKVALLSGLVALCAARWLFARFLPAADSDRDRLGRLLDGLAAHRETRVVRRRALAAGAVVGAAAVFLGAGIVAAGSPARGPVQEARVAGASLPTVEIDPSSLPRVTVDEGVASLSDNLAGSGAQALAVTLAENLEIEAQAVRAGDQRLLAAVDHGDRLDVMLGLLDDSAVSGERAAARYTFDSLHLVPIDAAGEQTGLAIGLEALGTMEEITHSTDGEEIGRTTEPFELTFVLSRPTGERWLIVDTLGAGSA